MMSKKSKADNIAEQVYAEYVSRYGEFADKFFCMGGAEEIKARLMSDYAEYMDEKDRERKDRNRLILKYFWISVLTIFILYLLLFVR